jgi:hypothetical protein
MDPNEKAIEIARDRRRLQLMKTPSLIRLVRAGEVHSAGVARASAASGRLALEQHGTCAAQEQI